MRMAKTQAIARVCAVPLMNKMYCIKTRNALYAVRHFPTRILILILSVFALFYVNFLNILIYYIPPAKLLNINIIKN